MQKAFVCTSGDDATSHACHPPSRPIRGTGASAWVSLTTEAPVEERAGMAHVLPAAAPQLLWSRDS